MIEITVGLCEAFRTIGINISEADLRKFEKALYERGLNVAPRQHSVLTSEAAILDAYSTPGLRRNNTETPHERTDASPSADSDLAPAAKRPA